MALSNKENCRNYYLRNREKKLAYQAQYRLDNKEKVLESNRRHYHENKEQYAANSKRWVEENRGRKNSHIANRRAAQLERTVGWSDKLVIDMIYEDCPEGMEVDHIIPLQGEKVSGLHVAWNLQYLTPEENRSKGNKYDIST